MIEGNKFIIYMLVATIIVIILSILTRDELYFIRFPAIAPFGFALLIFFVFLWMFERLYICPTCQGEGVINTTRLTRLLNEFRTHPKGEKCKFCNGSGRINTHQYYLDSIKGK